MRWPVGVTRNFLAIADLIGREREYQRFHRRAGQQVERRDHDPFLKARIVGLAERVPQQPVHRKDTWRLDASGDVEQERDRHSSDACLLHDALHNPAA